jgi:antitoxin ParD1/3/4
MNTVHLHLSADLEQFVARQAKAGDFSGPAAYIEALLERQKREHEELDSLLTEGLNSGEPIGLDAAEWSRIRAEVEQRLGSRKGFCSAG